MATGPSRTALRTSALVALCAGVPLAFGCYSLDDEGDAGPPTGKDGGTVDLSRDAGQYNPGQDAGNPPPPPPPPPTDAGPQPDAGPPAVQIVSFTADSETVAFLSSTTLRYNTANAQSCAIAPDIGAVELPSGSRVIEAGEPGDSVTYTLTCQGEGGPKTASVTLVTALVEHQGNYAANSAAELSSLSSINIVTGNLYIQGAQSVTDLSLLEGLVRVDGHLLVVANPALTTVNLSHLGAIGGGLFVDGNPALTSFDLPLLESVGGRLYASRNPQLPQAAIDGLVSQLSSAGGLGGPVIDYENDPSVMDALDQLMICTLNGQTAAYELDFSADGTVLGLNLENLDLYAGTYAHFEGQLELDFPGVTGRITATSTELEYDRVTRVSFSSEPGECFVSGLPGTGVDATRLYRCPTGGGPERMEVELKPGGAASWTNEPTSGNGAPISLPGAYVIDGDWVYFAFPDGIRADTPSLRFPIARFGDGGGSLDFVELPVGTTPCLLQ